MKRGNILLGLVLLLSACVPVQPTISLTSVSPATATLVPSTTTPTESVPTPSPAVRVSTAAQSMLTDFMRARIERDDRHVLDGLTDALKAELDNSTAVYQRPLLQVSNPCWYRFETLSFEQTEPTMAHARIRMFEHFWSGDSGGRVPSSWEQNITLTETTAGWRVSELGNLENERDEPNEPHGETISACIVVRTTTR